MNMKPCMTCYRMEKTCDVTSDGYPATVRSIPDNRYSHSSGKPYSSLIYHPLMPNS